MKNKGINWLVGIILIIGILIAVFVIYVGLLYASRTVKIVTVRDKWIKQYSGDGIYLFSDMNGSVYSIQDEIVFGKWEASDRWARLEVGCTYRITLYGWRIHFFSFYQNALVIEENYLVIR